MKVYQRLDKYIQSMGFKQTTIAQKVGLSKSKMSLILCGKSPLTADTLEDICRAMNVTPETIYRINESSFS